MKHHDEYVVIDIETTGLSYEDKIIEIAAVKVCDGGIVDTFSQLINPGVSISKKITALTGITNEMVADMPPIEQVMPSFVAFVSDLPVVGCNVSFDISRIQHVCESLGLESPPLARRGDIRYMARERHPDWDHHNLSTMRAYYNISDDNAHRALADVMATKRIYEFLYDEPCSADPFRVHLRRKHQTRWLCKEQLRIDGINICITGDIPGLERQQVKALIENLGGTVKSTVSKKVHYLVCGDFTGTPTTKRRDAEVLIDKGIDIRIISADELMSMLGYSGYVED